MRYVRLIVIVLITFSLSYWIIRTDFLSYAFFIDTTFLFTFLGVFIGFALTLYTYITSTFESIKRTIRSKYKDDEQTMQNKLSLLPILHGEIKDNIMFLIYSLIIVSILAVCDKYLNKLSINGSFCEVQFLKNAGLFTVFVLSVYALYDLVGTSFSISDFIVSDKSTDDKKK